MTLPFATEPPRVSVVVPAFNAAATIERALASVFSQTWRDFEVIVVDDGSTDATGTVLDRFDGAIVHLRQPNGGPGRARNAGVAHARGELVAFLDADDVWLPDKLERQVEYFDAFPSTGLLHGAVFLDDPDTVAIGRWRGARALSPPRQLFCEIFETAVEIRTLTVTVPRAVFRQVGGFDERREVHVEDWDLWLRIAAAHPVGYVPSPLAVHHSGGVMSGAADRTFEGQRLVLEKATPTYLAMCAALGRNPNPGMRRPRSRVAWELGYDRLARNETRAARKAFRTALRHDPTNLRAHLYHLGACLPGFLVSALRIAKRRVEPRHRPPRVSGRPSLSAGTSGVRRAALAHDTMYRRLRRAAADRLHRVDDALDAVADRRRRILFEAASPLSFAIFKPLFRRLSADPRVDFYYTSTSRSWPAETIFGSVGIRDRVIPSTRAAWMRFDACINTDFYEMTWLHRCGARLHMFHGVAGKYRIDSPVHVAPDIATFDALLFPNADRLERYLRAGLIDERAAMLVGFPKIDCLVDGSLDHASAIAVLDLPPGRPTILYAPTWSPDSSLHLMGEHVVRNLVDAHFNVLVKLHDRSYDLTRRASGGIDWTERLAAYAGSETVRIIRDPDASSYLMAADVLITDHSSIGFEYAVLDRPMIVLDAPNLMTRARITPQKVDALRAAARVITTADCVVEAVDSALAEPSTRSAERRHLANTFFYRPGTATDRAIGVVYDALGLAPPASTAVSRASNPRAVRDVAVARRPEFTAVGNE